MGIFTRFTDIVNANLNALLDKAEDPEKMVRLIIQEMEDTLVEVRSTSARLIAEKKDAERQAARFQQAAQDWESKAELALSKDREDLARLAIAERHQVLEQEQAVQDEMTKIAEHLERLNDEVAQLQEKLADAKARQKTIIMRQRAASTRLEVKKSIDSSKIDDAMIKFARYESKIDDIESQVEAYDMGKKTLRDEFAELESEDKVNDELEALRARMKKNKAE
ncbi:phage shock protein PspA [Pseudidiomarina taiwanensis]|uniref:Phage shock protein PspA n=1 Tax=Pseudidiomarina taiwanensis TaxID=337250 RepID=A0A432ZNG7_9GAMM|nr:phage shock protein PspA [Pseudidiomarina taiwanensis]RUO79434.1 phage shock protein PspA [Pseudidiomarina taiwanensis]